MESADRQQIREPQAAQPEKPANQEPSTAFGSNRIGSSDSARLAGFIHQDFFAVRNIVTALCGTQIDAESAVAEATARAVERLAAGRSIDALTAWITHVAVNIGRSELRRAHVRFRKLPALAPSEDTLSGIDLVPNRLDLRNALRDLNRRQAEVVALYYGLDLSIVEIARTLGRSEGTIKATLFHARSKLVQSLRTTPEEDGDGRH